MLVGRLEKCPAGTQSSRAPLRPNREYSAWETGAWVQGRATTDQHTQSARYVNETSNGAMVLVHTDTYRTTIGIRFVDHNSFH